METTLEQKLAPKGGFKKVVQRNMYQWHRIIGLITVIPVIFWTLSGLMHPFMSHWFKPKIAKEFILARPIRKEAIKLSLQEVLQQNGITQLKNFRLVSFKHQTYYQIKRVTDKLIYLNATTGRELPNGDLVYAEWMARELSQDSTSTIKAITVQSEFDNQYKFVNRLLPVYKVQFERADGLDVFVETESTRMATFNTNARKTFIWIFDVFHNWSFLEAIANNWVRITVMILLLSIIIISTLSGLVIYGFMWGKFKKPRNTQDQVGILRKYHRQIGLWVSFVTFTFAFSGAYHATKKYTPDERLKFVYDPIFKTEQIQQASLGLNLPWEKVVNLSLAKLKDQVYYQVFFKKEDDNTPQPIFVNATTGTELKGATIEYAKYLANKFSNMAKPLESDASIDCCEPTADVPNVAINEANLLKTDYLTKFDREYGFVNKRLPVVKLAYNTPDNTTYYIETATGRLATKVENSDRREGLSFAVLHKYFLMEWAGKDIRDMVTLISALGVLVVSVFGLVLFLKIK
ncbi:PepSY domain-containing protein [Flectobacillus major]|uniref:PepSY domain-containing protein n=1 Tax=Flectobacillus major TaxID=103 RepID=UPI00041C7408|nr:PepSY domain-containing protein [Flectobacillus major]